MTLRDASGAATMQATYTYDALDRRIGTQVDPDGSGPSAPVQTWTAYDGQNPYADYNAAGAAQQRYLYGPAVDALLARTDGGGTTAWYLTDKQGTVRDVATTAGTVLDHVAYDGFGNVTGETGAGGDRFKYAGREYDAATGLYFNRARYYDPQTGRFLSQDQSGFRAGDANLYRYAGNGPTNATDPTGHDAYSDAMSQHMQRQQAFQQQAYAWSTAHSTPGAGSSPDLLDQSTNFFAGYGHTMTFGAIDYYYRGMGYDAYIDAESAEYRAGGYVAAAQQAMMLSAAGNAALCRMAASGGSLGVAAQGTQALMRGYAAGNALSNLPGNAQGAYQGFQNGDYRAMGWSLYSAGRDLGLLGGMLGSCFAAGTPLRTPEGSRPIEAFRPGDRVLAAPENDPEGPVTPRLVEQVFRAEAALVTLEVGGRSIRTTAEHPFWVAGRGWTEASELIAGDRLRSHDGRWVVVAGVRDAGEVAAVYNLRVAEDHTYFVGGEGWGFSVWAHNTCWYHGTDNESAQNIFENGLNTQAQEQFDQPDRRGTFFYPHYDDALDQAENQTDWRARDNPNLFPVVIEADGNVIGPYLEQPPGQHAGEMYIPQEEYPNIPPGAFRPAQP